MPLALTDRLLAHHTAGLGKWMRFLGIVTLVFVALFALLLLLGAGTMVAAMASIPGGESYAALGTGGFVAVFGIFLAAYAWLGFQLYRGGSALRDAGRGAMTNALLAEGFERLGTLYKALVLLVVIGIVLVVLLPLLAVGAASAVG